jgi:cytochrome P450
MDGAPWLTRARAVAPVFHRDNVASAAGIVHRAAVSHASRWAQTGRNADLYAAVQQLGAETVMEIGFGFDPSDPSAVELAAALVAYKNRSMDPRPALRVDKLHVGASTVVRLPHIAYRMWRDHARVRRALRAALASARRSGRIDWTTRLQEAPLTQAALENEVNHLYGAFNAIDYVVTCGLWELGRRPELVTAIRAEIEATLGAREMPAGEDQQRMPVLNGFILELFRRYPVSMGIARALGAPLEVGGDTLPAGTQVLVLLHALHHHPDFWDAPWDIKPERWTSPQPRVPFSYVPFLLGARKCLGRDMAEQQMLLLLAAIVRRFNIAVFADAVIPPYMIPRLAQPIPFSLDAA